MENTFIVRYRRALHELKEAYRLQHALVDESDALRTLAYQQEQASEKAILKNRKSGRGFLISRLRECVEEEPYAWAVTQQLKRQIEEMEAGGYDSVVDNEQNHALYGVICDAISVLLDVLGNQFPKMLTGAVIATYRGNVPVSELVLKVGPTHLQRIVRQRLKAAADNPAPATTELPQLGSPALDTPTVAAYPWAEIEALAERIELRKNGRFLPADKWVPTAVAGMIDALCEAEILPPSGELKRLHAAFSRHYGRSIKADRVGVTRDAWQRKARKGLGLE
jgi:predicted RNA-binding protein YlxR (DUF448 family)